MSQATLRDLCAEAVAIEGAGAGTFLGAMRGHRSFAEAYAGVLPLAGVNLKIEEANAQGYIVRWENSTCTVTETGFTRVTCISSSNNGDFEEFSTGGYKRAFVFIPVADVGGGSSGITPGTKSEYNTALTDGDFAFSGDAPTAHTHALSNLTQSGATTSQVATWNGTAWVPTTPSGGGMTVGSDVTGGTANCLLYVDAAGKLANSANGTFNPATGVRVTGALTCNHPGGNFLILIPGGSLSAFQFDGSRRFGVLAATSESDIGLTGYPMQCLGATKSTLFGNLTYDQSDLGSRVGIYTHDATKPGWIIQLESGQTADAWEVKSSGGAVIASTSAGGDTYARTTLSASFTVATLPSGVVTQRAWVSDETTGAFRAPCVGGGSIEGPAHYGNGAWKNG